MAITLARSPKASPTCSSSADVHVILGTGRDKVNRRRRGGDHNNSSKTQVDGVASASKNPPPPRAKQEAAALARHLARHSRRPGRSLVGRVRSGGPEPRGRAPARRSRMSSYSLDTDTVTKLLKKHPGNQHVIQRFRREIRRNSLFVICPVVYYELRRGLLFKEAHSQLVAFESLAKSMVWREFNAPIWDQASILWSALRARGRSHHDADVLIAAHALHYGAVIVTANLTHFQGTGAVLENWDGPLVRS